MLDDTRRRHPRSFLLPLAVATGIFIVGALPTVWAQQDSATFEVVATDGKPTDSVHLGQGFKLRCKIPEIWDPQEYVEVELKTPRGDTAPVRLKYDRTEGGYLYYESDELSIGGKRGGFDYAGTVTGLDDLANGESVSATLTGFLGSSARGGDFTVYDNRIAHITGIYHDHLRRASDDLVRQQIAINTLKNDPKLTPAARADLNTWQARVTRRLRYLAEGRNVIRLAKTPKARMLAYETTYREVTRPEDLLMGDDMVHMDAMRDLSRRMRQVLTDNMVDAMYTAAIGTYMLASEVTMGRSIVGATFKQDAFGRKLTTGQQYFAAGELFVAYVAIRGLPKLIDWLGNNSHTIMGPVRPVRSPTRPVAGPTPSPRPASPSPSASGTGSGRPPRAGPPPPPSEPYSPTTSWGELNPPNVQPPTTIKDVLARIKVNLLRKVGVPGTNINCQWCVDEVWRVLRGAPTRQARQGYGGNVWEYHVDQVTRLAPADIPGGKQWHSFFSRQGIEKAFAALPALSHGRVIGVRGAGKPDHIFNVWKDAGGKVWFIDGQTGTLARFSNQGYKGFEVLVTDVGPRGAAASAPAPPLRSGATPPTTSSGPAASGHPPGARGTRPATGRVEPDVVAPPVVPMPPNEPPPDPTKPQPNLSSPRSPGAALPGTPADPFSIPTKDINPAWTSTPEVPDSFNPPADILSLLDYADVDAMRRSSGTRDLDVQVMMLDGDSAVDDVEPVVLVVRHRVERPGFLSRFFAALHHTSSGSAGVPRALVMPRASPTMLYTGVRSPVALEPRTIHRPSEDGAPAVGVFLASLGESTGEAFNATFVNLGTESLQLQTEGLVVEPLEKKEKKRQRKEMDRLTKSSDRHPLTTKLNAYCLEFRRQPPPAGTVFRVADSSAQRRFAPMRRILRASRNLRDQGMLTPDSDPKEYFHSIRQWAIWTHEGGFDVERFGEEFVDRAKQNFTSAKRAWTNDVEQLVRGLVPGRWADIQKVLLEARTPEFQQE